MTRLARLGTAAIALALLSACSAPAAETERPCDPLTTEAVEDYIDDFDDITSSAAPPAELAVLAQDLADDLTEDIAPMEDGPLKNQATGAARRVQAHADALRAADPTGIDADVVNTAGDAAAALVQLAADCYVREDE